ncbi:MAG TPA: KH domain-containing protein [Acidimicrobiales bacterium]
MSEVSSPEATDTDTAAGGNDAPAGDGVAPTAQAVLRHVVGSLVEDRDAIRIDAETGGATPRLTVRVGRSDMGRVIGKRGRVAQAIRTVVRAAAVRDGTDVEVEFED